MNDPAAEDVTPGADRPGAAAEDVTPGADWSGAAAAGAETAAGSAPLPDAAGSGLPPDVVAQPGFRSPFTGPGRDKIVAVAAAGAAIAILAGILIYALISHLNSTDSVRVIVPAPAAAGGLHQDYADEGGQFQGAVSGLRRHFGKSIAGGSVAAAIYTNAPAGRPARTASFVLVYLGFNAGSNGPSPGGPAEAVKSALSGISSFLSHASTTQEGGGAGDTRFACVTGTTVRTVVVCAWGTDRTVGLLIPQVPGVTVGRMAALMKKMEPDLVRG